MQKKTTETPVQKKLAESSSLTLTAVAFQDHWSRSLALGTNFGPRKVGLGPAARAKQKREARTVIDTGRNRVKKQTPKNEEIEKEYVLDKKPPPLTLAQKFGLVHAPKQLLSEQEWSSVKAKSNQRDDSQEPCVICKEDFGLDEQVLLSCTHVFHRACLQAFERFTGKKTCPMCRHDQYQTRVIHEGARIHKHKSAARIQSWWRGYVVRCWYRQLRERIPPKDPMLRKKFYEEKLSGIVDRMIKSIDVNMTEFMREIDNSVEQSRAVFSMWDSVHNVITPDQWEAIQLKAVERGDVDCPICLTELHLTGDYDNGRTSSMSDATNTKNNNGQKHTHSSHTQNKNPQTTQMNRRKSQDVKLLEKLSQQVDAKSKKNLANDVDKVPEDETQYSDGKQQQRNQTCESNPRRVRSTVLLSCTHIFHSTCLKTLEDIAMLDMTNTCPVCRAHYQKKIIVF